MNEQHNKSYEYLYGVLLGFAENMTGVVDDPAKMQADILRFLELCAERDKYFEELQVSDEEYFADITELADKVKAQAAQMQELEQRNRALNVAVVALARGNGVSIQ